MLCFLVNKLDHLTSSLTTWPYFSEAFNLKILSSNDMTLENFIMYNIFSTNRTITHIVESSNTVS